GVRGPHQGWAWPDWVVLTREDIAELTERWRNIKNPVWTATGAIAQSFRELAPCITSWERPHIVSRMTVHLNLLLASVLDAVGEQQSRNGEPSATRQRLVELFLQDLKSGRMDLDETWTLHTIATHCKLGVTAFSKYCRELVNIGPVEYLNQ